MYAGKGVKAAMENIVYKASGLKQLDDLFSIGPDDDRPDCVELLEGPCYCSNKQCTMQHPTREQNKHSDLQGEGSIYQSGSYATSAGGSNNTGNP